MTNQTNINNIFAALEQAYAQEVTSQQNSQDKVTLKSTGGITLTVEFTPETTIDKLFKLHASELGIKDPSQIELYREQYYSDYDGEVVYREVSGSTFVKPGLIVQSIVLSGTLG